MDAWRSRAACERADIRHLWMLEQVLEQSDNVTEVPLFADRCATDQLTLASYPQEHVGLSTADGSIVMTSAS